MVLLEVVQYVAVGAKVLLWKLTHEGINAVAVTRYLKESLLLGKRFILACHCHSIPEKAWWGDGKEVNKVALMAVEWVLSVATEKGRSPTTSHQEPFIPMGLGRPAKSVYESFYNYPKYLLSLSVISWSCEGPFPSNNNSGVYFEVSQLSYLWSMPKFSVFI